MFLRMCYHRSSLTFSPAEYHVGYSIDQVKIPKRLTAAGLFLLQAWPGMRTVVAYLFSLLNTASYVGSHSPFCRSSIDGNGK